jgi:CRP/FNR family cyclic AMP-dependent transcriptional regulator
MAHAAGSKTNLIVPEAVRQILADHGRMMRVRKDQVLLAVGLSASDVYLVVEGLLCVSLVSAQGRETVLRSIGPGRDFWRIGRY